MYKCPKCGSEDVRLVNIYDWWGVKCYTCSKLVGYSDTPERAIVMWDLKGLLFRVKRFFHLN